MEPLDVVRVLDAKDLEELGAGKTAPRPLKRLRERHHAVARLVAEGLKDVDIANILGYDPGRISILKGDPSFKDLVEFYRNDVREAFRTKQHVMAEVYGEATTQLLERLEETDVPLGALIRIVELSADRSGVGPTSTQQVNVNVNLADRLEQARKRVAARTLELQRNRDLDN